MSSTILVDPGRTKTPDILVVTNFHPFPAHHGNSVRTSQYIRYLGKQGFGIDLAVLSDCPSERRDRELARMASIHCKKVMVVRHPAVTSRVMKFAYRLWGRAGKFRLGDWLHCPGRFQRALRRHFGRDRYRAVIISGVHLARLTAQFRPSTRKILEAADVWYDRYRSFSAFGRGAELENFADPRREADLVNRFDAVVSISSRDVEIYRSMGVRRPMVVVPFVADEELLGRSRARGEEDPAPEEPPEGNDPGETKPIRPPRILFVGSDGVYNLDGLRFFRSRVFPAIRRRVPTCRLRVVGQSAYHLAPGPGVELVGWSDELAREYREAALVVVPLRMGSGLKTKVVEALSHGKALVTTSVGIQGIDLESGRDGVVTDDPAVMAEEAVRILLDDSVRRALESNARKLARRLFDPDLAFRPLLDLLTPEDRPSRIKSPRPLEAATG